MSITIEQELKEYLDRFEQNFNKLDKKIDKLDEKLEQKLEKLDEKINKLDEKIDKLDEKFEQKLEKLDEKFEQKLEKLDEKVDRLTVDITTVKTKVENLDKNMTELGGTQKAQIWTLIGIISTALLGTVARYLFREGNP